MWGHLGVTRGLENGIFVWEVCKQQLVEDVELKLSFLFQEDLLSHRGHMHGHLGAILASLGGVLGASWPDAGPSWGHPGA